MNPAYDNKYVVRFLLLAFGIAWALQLASLSGVKMGGTTGLGVIMVWLYKRSGSIWIPALGHGVLNAVAKNGRLKRRASIARPFFLVFLPVL